MQKNSYINWLKAIGIEYYCSETSLRHYEHMIPFPKTNHQIVELQDSACSPKSTSANLVLGNSMSRKEIHPSEKAITHPVKQISPTQTIEALPKQGGDAKALARSLSDQAQNLDELKQYVLNFDGCSLKLLANNTVFGDGNKAGIVMLIGEAPGAKEDATGIPFCGDSGKLLDNMLLSVNISRLSNAYITNAVFWRPPGNRQPTTEEVEICRPFVEKHIALINPKLIILVGNTAATSLLGKNLGVTKIRQEYYLYSNKYLAKPIHTTAIFHPAYLLRQPTQKKTIWYDLLKIKEFLEQVC
jgi:uracil-DNA glycosylase family 4